MESNIKFKKNSNKYVVEGTSNTEPTEDEILEHVEDKGFLAENVEIFHDKVIKSWRFLGDIIASI